MWIYQIYIIRYCFYTVNNIQNGCLSENNPYWPSKTYIHQKVYLSLLALAPSASDSWFKKTSESSLVRSTINKKGLNQECYLSDLRITFLRHWRPLKDQEGILVSNECLHWMQWVRICRKRGVKVIVAVLSFLNFFLLNYIY